MCEIFFSWRKIAFFFLKKCRWINSEMRYMYVAHGLLAYFIKIVPIFVNEECMNFYVHSVHDTLTSQRVKTISLLRSPINKCTWKYYLDTKVQVCISPAYTIIFGLCIMLFGCTSDSLGILQKNPYLKKAKFTSEVLQTVAVTFRKNMLTLFKLLFSFKKWCA